MNRSNSRTCLLNAGPNRAPINFVTVVTLSAALAGAASAAAGPRQDGAVQPPATPPTGAAAVATASGKTTAVVVDVLGKVGIKSAPGQPFKAAEKGMTLNEGAEIKTVLNSAIIIRIGTAQLLTIDKMTTVALRQAINDAGTERTLLDLPYGRVKFDITSTAVANDVRIQAPDATLAVKGTQGLMDATPGFATMASGGDMNTGQFNVTYSTGVTGVVTSNQTTTLDAPSPADQGVDTTGVDTGPAQSRDGDESQVVQRAPGGGDSGNLALGGQATPPPPPPNQASAQFFLNGLSGSTGITLVRINDNNSRAVLRSGPGFSSSVDPNVNGLALSYGQQGNAPQVLALSSLAVGGWRLSSLLLGDPMSSFVTLAMDNSPAAPSLLGLGTIGPRVFAGGDGGGQIFSGYGIYEILVGSNSTQRRMDLPFIEVGDDIAGVTSRGSLLLFGVPDSTLGAPTPGFLSGTLFEVDPRTNSVLSVVAQLNVGPTTVFADGLAPADIAGASVVGISTVGGSYIVALSDGSGTNMFALVNPSASGTATNPTIIRVSASMANVLGGLASETPNAPPAPRSFGAPTSQIDSFLSPLFAQMSYTPQAAGNPFFRQLITGEIVRTAEDPSGCASIITPAMLAAFLGAHTNQNGGVGQAVADFRASLTLGHPCRGPGQTGFLPDTVFTTVGSTDLGGYSLGETFSLVRSGLDSSGLSRGNGLGFLTQATGQRTLLRLEASPIAADQTQFTLRSLLFGQAAAPFATLLSFVAPGQLTGIDTIGQQVYTLAENVNIEFPLPSILEVGLSGGGSLTRRMCIPADMEGVTDFAGSNSRGSLFVVAEANPTGSNALPQIFEVDPRSNYFKSAFGLNIGTSTVLGPGVDPDVFTQNNVVQTGMAYVGGMLVMTVLDTTTGFDYFIQINPARPGTLSQPTVTRISRTNFNVSGLASGEAVSPPSPISLSPQNGAIDPFIEPLFALAGYSTQAAASNAFRTLVAREIDRTSIAPGTCFGSLSLSTVGSFLNGRINQSAGIGTAINDLRISLPGGHPCLGPGTMFFGGESLYLSGSNLRRYNESTNVDSLVATAIPGVSTLPDVGLAVDAFGRASNPLLLQLSSSGSMPNNWTLSQLSLNNPSAGFSTTFSSQSPVRLSGLASLGGEYFASGLPAVMGNFDPYQIVSLNASGVVFNGGFDVASAQPAALTGAPERGSIFGVADFNFGPPPVGGLGSLGQVFEYDPRALNLLGTDAFVTGPSTIITGGINPDNITGIVGASYVGNRIIFSVTLSGGGRAFVTFNPNAAGTANDPTVVRIAATAFLPRELAGESSATPPQPQFANGPTVFADSRVGFQINNISYQPGAAGAAANMLRRMVLGSAQNPAVCQTDGVFSSINSIVLSHANQSQGVAQSMFDFRQGLGFNHPCQITQNRISFFEYDESSGNLIRRNIQGGSDGVERVGITGFTPVSASGGMGMVVHAGLAAIRTATEQTLYRIESIDTGTGFSNSLLSFDLQQLPPFNAAVTVLDMVAGPELKGLASVGNDLFVSGAVGEAGRTGISFLNRTTGALTLAIDTPFLGGLFNTCGIGSSNERGTLFVPSQAPVDGGLPRFSILEFDPRNNLLVDAFTIDNGRLTLSVGTQNNASGFIDFAQIERVDSIAYNQGALTVAATAAGVSGPIVFTINQGGDNSPGNPSVIRVDPLPARRFGFAGQLPIQPPAPQSLANPNFPGGIDMRGMSALFADLAYTTQAFNTGVPSGFARSAVLAAARDSAGCISSTELANIGPFVGSNVNLRAGIGRSVTQFRQSLPLNHPCTPP